MARKKMAVKDKALSRAAKRGRYAKKDKLLEKLARDAEKYKRVRARSIAEAREAGPSGEGDGSAPREQRLAEEYIIDIDEESVVGSGVEPSPVGMMLVTVKMPETYVDGLDRLVRLGRYASRSEAIRIAVRELLQRELWSAEERTSPNTIVLEREEPKRVWLET